MLPTKETKLASIAPIGPVNEATPCDILAPDRDRQGGAARNDGRGPSVRRDLAARRRRRRRGRGGF